MRRNEERLLEMGFDRAVEFLKMELFECYRRSDISATAVSSTNSICSDQEAEVGTSRPSCTSISPTGRKSSFSSGGGGKVCYRTNEFVRDAFEVKVTPFLLDTFAGEFDTQVRAANAHRREVEALRLVNRNLASRVKTLEDQLNSLNAEHVDMVKDVVMAKIAKEEMAEELVKYKMMYAEAVLAADRESGNNRSSAAGQRAAAALQRDSSSSNPNSSAAF